MDNETPEQSPGTSPSPAELPSPTKRSLELIVPKSETRGFFRKLGEDMASGQIVFGETRIDLAGFKTASVELKDQGDSLLVELKIKYPKAGPKAGGSETAEHTGGIKYKSLKKRMKGTWRTILERLAAGALPPADILASFVEDSRLMCTYPGMGEPFYPGYLSGLEALVAAVEAEDPASARIQALALDQLKKDCHARYK